MADKIDFSFFDEPKSYAAEEQFSDEENDKNAKKFPIKNLRLRKSFSSSSDNESTSTHPSELHGTGVHNSSSSSNGKHAVISPTSSVSSSSSSSSGSKSSIDESHSDSKSISEHSSSSSDYESSKTSSASKSDSSRTSSEDNRSTSNTSLSSSKKRNSSSKRIRKSLRVNTSSSSHSDSSDTMTDVSPLVSPEKSPNLNRSSNSNANASGDQSHDTSYRHITKLNVVFRDSESESSHDQKQSHHKKQKHPAPSGRRKQNNIQWSSESDDEDVISPVNLDDYLRRRSLGKAAQTSQSRHDSAAYQHRQRLLDSAATGSMDISNLLETVLEFEKQNNQRKVGNQVEMPMNYRIGEKFVQNHERRRKKNMSFSNEKVREIDLENQRLLKKISNQSRPSSASSVRSSISSRSGMSSCSRSSRASSRSISSKKRDSDKPVRLYHSALNRLQFQRRIERENMQLLKRLQSAKPTPGLQRQRQLHHYKQQSDYMGTTINRNGMTLQKATELTRNAEVVQKAIGLSKKQPVRPGWQDRW